MDVSIKNYENREKVNNTRMKIKTKISFLGKDNLKCYIVHIIDAAGWDLQKSALVTIWPERAWYFLTPGGPDIGVLTRADLILAFIQIRPNETATQLFSGLVARLQIVLEWI